MSLFKRNHSYNRILTTDFHSHILPRMDDGSNSAELSKQMIRSLNDQGISRICLTSHFYRNQNDIDSFLARREASIKTLFGADCPPDSFAVGAEVAFFNGVSREENLNKLCYNGKNILLLEMPFCEWYQNQMEEVISLYLDRGMQVILAHPERYLFIHSNREMLKTLAGMHIAFQVNAGTIANRKTREEGLELLEMSRLPLLGSDTHNMDQRPPRIGEAEKVLEKKGYTDLLEQIKENGDAILANGL